MAKKNFSLLRGCAVFAAAGVTLGLAGNAFAQGDMPSQDKESIVVVAPHYSSQPSRIEQGHMIGQLVSYSIPVSYADLDLRNPSDSAQLRQRIADAAREACARLDSKYPQSVFPALDNSNCQIKTTDQALAQVDWTSDRDG